MRINSINFEVNEKDILTVLNTNKNLLIDKITFYNGVKLYGRCGYKGMKLDFTSDININFVKERFIEVTITSIKAGGILNVAPIVLKLLKVVCERDSFSINERIIMIDVIKLMNEELKGNNQIKSVKSIKLNELNVSDKGIIIQINNIQFED